PDIQDFAVSLSGKKLRELLKKSGDYSVLFGIILSVYAAAKKLGIGITFLQSKIIAAGLAVCLGVSGYAGGRAAASYVSGFLSGEKETREKVDNSGVLLKSDVTVETAKPGTGRFFFGVNTFAGHDADTAKSVSNMITAELVSVIGYDKVTLLEYQDRRKADKIVMGSVRILGKQTIITARVVNVQTARTEFATSEKISSLNELDKACRRIADKIAGRFR
ncbi:MAG: hypothetical protein MUC95_09560, partial [Spirochaetes bacterium]|nr:hypothetical protein [Spirochaetota bacterium]